MQESFVLWISAGFARTRVDKWVPDIIPVSGDATYTATYTNTTNEYLIQFVNYDGEVLQSGDIAFGETPVYSGATPTKPRDAEFTYTFSRWDPEVAPVSGDATYTAIYSGDINEYLIQFVNYDGEVVQSGDVAFGELPVYSGEIPTKSGDAEFSYTFDKWEPEIAIVSGDAIYTATFTKTTKEYLIQFVNYDGEVLQSDDVAYGDMPIYGGATPTKSGNAEFSYTFDKWEPEIVTVSGDKVYTATFTSTTNKYLIQFKDYDGIILQSDEVEYGVMPTYSGDIPTRSGDEEGTYEFDTWDPEISEVSGDMTYTATYIKTYFDITYTVTYDKNTTDNVIRMPSPLSFEKQAGESVTLSNRTPRRTGYNFLGWALDPDATVADYQPEDEYTLSGDRTLYAVWERIYYLIIFENYDGTILQSGDVEYGTLPEYSGDVPTKSGDDIYSFTFIGWSPEIVSAKATATYTAQFKSASREAAHSLLKVGDWVKYEPTSNSVVLNSTDELQTGYDYSITSNSATITTDTSTLWRVWDVSGDAIRIIPSTELHRYGLYMGGFDGYKNGTGIVETLCSSLYNSPLTASVRSLNCADLSEKSAGLPFENEKYAFFAKDDTTELPSNSEYTRIRHVDLSNDKDTTFVEWDDDPEIAYISSQYKEDSATGIPYLTLKNGHPVFVSEYYYYGTPEWNSVSDTNVDDVDDYGDLLRKILFSWLPDRMVTFATNYGEFQSAHYGLEGLEGSKIAGTTLISSERWPQVSTTQLRGRGIMPIVTLRTDLHATEGRGTKEENAWVLELDD